MPKTPCDDPTNPTNPSCYLYLNMHEGRLYTLEFQGDVYTAPNGIVYEYAEQTTFARMLDVVGLYHASGGVAIRLTSDEYPHEYT
jgi:hypothetical protein